MELDKGGDGSGERILKADQVGIESLGTMALSNFVCGSISYSKTTHTSKRIC